MRWRFAILRRTFVRWASCFPDAAAVVTAVDHGEQIADFIEAEAQLATAPDENKPPQIPLGI